MPIALIVLVAGTGIAAFIDVRSRRIPNVLTGTMALAAVALHLFAGLPAMLLMLCVLMIAFALGTFAFWAGWFGGGDVKLLTAACALVSYPGCLLLVACIFIAGGVLSLVEAARTGRLAGLLANATSLVRTGAMRPSQTLLPYGVAIAGGSVAYAVATFLPALKSAT